jgi:MipA family protein
MLPLRLAALAIFCWGGTAAAQERTTRTRVVLGPQLVPSYPGADGVSVRPLIDVSRARGDDPFLFEAPDESFGPTLFQTGRLAAGPSVGFEGRRRGQDVGTALPTVGFTVELGGFVQYQLTEPVRLRAEVRRGIGGHDGWIGSFGADYVRRDRDEWLWSIGPRLTVTDARYQRAYFGVRPQDAVASGLPAFDADGGLQAVGVTAGHLRQLTRRWGLYGYARYDRLVADAARSPIVREYGSRNQLSGGIALSYTFGR